MNIEILTSETVNVTFGHHFRALPMRPIHRLAEFPPAALYYLFVSILISSLPLCISSLQGRLIDPLSSWVGVTYWIDSLLLNGVSLLITTWLLSRKLLDIPSRHCSLGDYAIVFGKVLICCGLALVLSWALEVLIFKPAFAHHRPAVSVGETFFVKFVGHDISAAGSSTPSGFALRQVLMLLACVLSCYRPIHEKTRARWSHDKVSVIMTSVVLVITVAVSFARVARGLHRLLDIGIGGACAYFRFLLGCYLLFCLERRRKELSRVVLSMLLVFGPVFFFYSGSGASWVTLILAAVVLISIPEFIPER